MLPSGHFGCRRKDGTWGNTGESKGHRFGEGSLPAVALSGSNVVAVYQQEGLWHRTGKIDLASKRVQWAPEGVKFGEGGEFVMVDMDGSLLVAVDQRGRGSASKRRKRDCKENPDLW